MPAFRAADPGAGDQLKAGGRSSGSVSQRRLRGTLVAAEVALAIVLLVSAGLLVRSFSSIMDVDRGYRSDHVLGALMFTWGQTPTPALRRQFVGRLVDRARSLPGVVAAGVTSSPPLGGSVGLDRTPFTIPGRPLPPGQFPQVHVTSLSPGAIDALRMVVLRGRAFTAQDDSASEQVALHA